MAAVERRKQFEFLCGTGTLRAKAAPDQMVIRSGQISLPHLGQCYIDGVHSRLVDSCTLEVKKPSADGKGREVVARLILPVGMDAKLEGKLVVGEGRKRETYKVVAETRRDANHAPYRALRLPDVKVAAEDMRSWRKRNHLQHVVA